MAGKYVLALDIGTSGGRCLAFDINLNQVASASRQWKYFTPDDAPSLARELEPRSFWRTICTLIKATLKSGGIVPDDVAAVAVTCQRQGIALLDSKGRELYIGPNLDLRAVFEGAALDEKMGARIKQTTGHLPSFFFAPAKLLWFQAHRPDLFTNIAHVLTLADWCVGRLTGVQASETTLAGEAGLLDVSRRSWCRPLLKDIGLDSKILPPLAQSGAVIGSVTRQASRLSGLSEGTPVALGGADTQCGVLGLGASGEGQVGIVAGWSAPLQMVTSRPIVTPDGRSWTGCYLPKGKWVLECNPGDVGNAYSWLKGVALGNRRDAFGHMDRLAQDAPVGSQGAIAFIGTGAMDTSRLGLRAGGLLFPVPLTFESVELKHLVRAVLEASAYSIKANLLQLQDIAGLQAKDVRLGGGMTRTRVFVQILADVLGRRVLVSTDYQVSALGSALCAATAIGTYKSLDEASASRRLIVVEPDPLRAAEYQDYYERWLDASKQLESIQSL